MDGSRTSIAWFFVVLLGLLPAGHSYGYQVESVGRACAICCHGPGEHAGPDAGNCRAEGYLISATPQEHEPCLLCCDAGQYKRSSSLNLDLLIPAGVGRLRPLTHPPCSAGWRRAAAAHHACVTMLAEADIPLRI